ncbi:hypothetical protein [Streptomyces naphthomycinicus]|uniref:hypothetical protein n=1 Tax=Streptomyces naphthomycinicus TaxID=2872625 RepID=UPI001CEDBEC4|nr:hypothetical protein [Streptomyces sp. TML10]
MSERHPEDETRPTVLMYAAGGARRTAVPGVPPIVVAPVAGRHAVRARTARIPRTSTGADA